MEGNGNLWRKTESKWKNLHKAIYVSFQKTKLFSPTQGLFK